MHGAAVATIVGGRLVYLHPDYTRINELKQAPRIGVTKTSSEHFRNSHSTSKPDYFTAKH